MKEHNQSFALAPARIHQRSDEVYATINSKFARKERCNKCFVCLLALFVMLCTIVLVLAIIVTHPTNPGIKLSSVKVKNLEHGNGKHAYFNVTLVAKVTVKNANFGEFRYVRTNGSVYYGGMIIGVVIFRHGSVEARETKVFNVPVDVRSYRLQDTRFLSIDINQGIVNLTSYAELKGTVHLVEDHVMKIRTAKLDCGMRLNFRSQSIQHLVCN
ncbi:LEA_2 domain-containing protein [Cephalotus follicularis]|uniref:LEA_2 domain-containing protein n=1 Tax=Cephalotus follicularis TaxID=3775 RepID=A0A1Q3CYC9_CEPFO|nr:LEA_2 domain-containing protein [Cephalotus follicularis]